MRVLVGWDDDTEIELLTMYLQVEDNEVEIVRDAESLIHQFREYNFDVALYPISFPDADKAFETFQALQKVDPHVPILVAVKPGEIYPLSRMIRHGLRSHVYRDPDGEYLFLLQTLLESILAGKRAEEDRLLADRLREEVESVRKLQESIIPTDMRAPDGYKIIARYEPSQIRVQEGNPVILAGGDYYDAFQLDDQRLVILVGDASGHGMKACMSIMIMHTLVNQLQQSLNRPPNEFVAEINRRLCTQELIQGDGGFITLLFGVLEDNILRWTSSGHCLPLLQNMETGEIKEMGNPKTDGGPPLAVWEESEYDTIKSEIPPGHRLMIYTDGIIEAFPGEKEHREFGLKGVIDTLKRCQSRTLEETLDALFEDSFNFTEGSGRHDDTSVLLLERRS